MRMLVLMYMMYQSAIHQKATVGWPHAGVNQNVSFSAVFITGVLTGFYGRRSGPAPPTHPARVRAK